MRAFHRLALLLCSVLPVVPAIVTAQEPSILITGLGQQPCSAWLRAREDKLVVQIDLYEQWVAGFAGGHNYYLPTRQADARLDQVRYVIDKYCRDHPTHALMAAAAQYVEEVGGTASKLKSK